MFFSRGSIRSRCTLGRRSPSGNSSGISFYEVGSLGQRGCKLARIVPSPLSKLYQIWARHEKLIHFIYVDDAAFRL